MSILGRGLSSLIPRREAEDAEDIIEQIDSMEETEVHSVPVQEIEEEETVTEATPAPIEVESETVQTRVAIVSEDEVEDEAETETEPSEVTEVIEEPVASRGLDDFEELTEMEAMPMPSKPLVTPLQLDPETGTLRDPALIAQERRPILKHVRASEIVQRAKARPAIIKPIEEVSTLTETNEVEQIPPQEVAEPTPIPTEVEPEHIETPTPVENPSEPVATVRKQRVENEVWDRHEERVELVNIGDIQVNPNQPRRTFNPDELEELKQSIDQHGILQPLVVLRKGDHYELVAGERRLRASKLLGWNKVPCVVRTDIYTDRNSLELALIENIQRENLNPIEEAMGYKLLNEEYGMSHEEIGQRVGRSRVNITNVIRILQLPAEIQRGLIEGKLTVGHARAILMIPDEEKQLRFYHHMLEEGLTVRKAETRARRIQRQMKINDPMRKKTRGRPQLALKYDGVLEERFGHTARVKFNETKNRFEVFFYAFSENEAEDLINRLLGERQPLEYPEDNDEA